MLATELRQIAAELRRYRQPRRRQRRVPVRRHLDRHETVRARQHRRQLRRRSDYPLHPRVRQPGAGRRPPGHRSVHEHHRGERHVPDRGRRRQYRQRHDRRRHASPTPPPGSPTTTRSVSPARPTGWSRTTRCRHRCRWRRAADSRPAAPSSSWACASPSPARRRRATAFTVQPPQDTDLFSMLDNLINTLTQGTGLPSDRAVFQQQIGASIASLDQGLDRVSTVRAEVGTRLSAIDTAADARETEAIDLQQLALGSARPGLRRGHQPAQPGIRGSAGRAGGLHADLAALPVRLSVGFFVFTRS